MIENAESLLRLAEDVDHVADRSAHELILDQLDVDEVGLHADSIAVKRHDDVGIEVLAASRGCRADADPLTDCVPTLQDHVANAVGGRGIKELQQVVVPAVVRRSRELSDESLGLALDQKELDISFHAHGVIMPHQATDVN